MRGIKRILALFMLLVMAVSLCSCLGASALLKGIASSSEEIIKKDTMAYMKEKYCGQEFVCAYVEERYKSTVIDCYPKGSDIETDPMKMTVPKLKEWLTAEGITFDADANKATLQALVPARD